MKTLLLTTALFLTTLLSGYSQAIKVSEPEWEGEAIFVNDSIGKGLTLERQEGTLKTKSSASVYMTGIGKTTAVLSVKGDASTVRLKKNSEIKFIYRFKDNGANPKNLIQVVALTKKKSARTVEVGSYETFAGASEGNLSYVEFKAEKYGTSSYLITITDLKSGEYALSTPSSNTMYLFGIDE